MDQKALLETLVRQEKWGPQVLQDRGGLMGKLERWALVALLVQQELQGREESKDLLV